MLQLCELGGSWGVVFQSRCRWKTLCLESFFFEFSSASLILRITFLPPMSPRRKYFLRTISLGVFLAAIFLSLNYFKDDSVLVGEILPGFPDDADVDVRFINNRGEIAGNTSGWDTAGNDYQYTFLWSEENGITNLNKLPPGSAIIAMNDHGQLLLLTYGKGAAPFELLFWSKETGPIEIKVSRNHTSSSDISLNNAGQVAGNTFEGNDTTWPFFWSLDTQLVKIADNGFVTKINQHGQVVGKTENGIFIWSKEQGMRYLAPTAKWFSDLDTNDKLQIVGYKYDPKYKHGGQVFFWSEPTGMLKLATTETMIVDSTNINCRGQVLTTCNDQPDEFLPYFWSLESGLIKIAPPNAKSAATRRMNDHGQVVGAYQTSLDGPKHPFFWSLDTGIKHLSFPGANHVHIKSINNQGTIIGTAYFEPKWWMRSLQWVANKLDLPNKYHPEHYLRFSSEKAIIWRVPPSDKAAKNSPAK